MASWVSYLAAFVLVAHGLVHVLGTAVYLRLGEVTGFAYKTTSQVISCNFGRLRLALPHATRFVLEPMGR